MQQVLGNVKEEKIQFVNGFDFWSALEFSIRPRLLII